MRNRSDIARVIAAGAAGVVVVAGLTAVAGAAVGHPSRSQATRPAGARVELVASSEVTTTAALGADTTAASTTVATSEPTVAPTTSSTEAEAAETSTAEADKAATDASDADDNSADDTSADDTSADDTSADDTSADDSGEAKESDDVKESDSTTTVAEDPSRPMTFRVADAGTITFTRVGNVLTITSIDAKSGWTAGQPTGDPHEWHVVFTHGDKTLRLTIVVKDGKVTVRIEETHAGTTTSTTQHVEHTSTTTAPHSQPEPTTTATTASPTSTTKA